MSCVLINIVVIVLIPDVNGVVGVVLTAVDWGLGKIWMRQKISRYRPMAKDPGSKDENSKYSLKHLILSPDIVTKDIVIL